MPVLPHAQHAAPRSPIRGPALPIGVAVTAIGVLLSIGSLPSASSDAVPMPEPVAVLQVPTVQVGATTAADPCADPTVQQAVADGDDVATIAGFGVDGLFAMRSSRATLPASRSPTRHVSGSW